MITFLYNLLLFTISLSLLVTIHECGHFFAARACAVRVERFSIGFGRVIFCRRGRDGCEYVISLLPLGGYVRMQGENSPQTEEDTGSFASKSIWQRALIIGAGPLCNLLLAWLLYGAVFMIGSTVLRPVVGDVSPEHGLARGSALAPYDEIRSVEGRAVSSWPEVLLAIADHAGTQVTLEVAADLGRGALRQVVLNLEGLRLSPQQPLLEALGIQVCHGRVSTELELVTADSPAARAGLQPGDRIVAVDGVEMDSFYRIADYIHNYGFRPLRFVIAREGKLYESVITPERVSTAGTQGGAAAEGGYRIGVGARTERLEELYTFVSYPFAEAMQRAVEHTCDMSWLIVRQLYRMLNGAASVDSLSGPITIARGAGESAALGFTFYMAFLALISVNLGILNLLPIPVLDGGQLLFIAYEAVFRRRPSAQAQWLLTVFGFTLLMILTLFALINDLRAL